MRVLVCGSRDFSTPGLVAHVLDRLVATGERSPVTLLHGAARGADTHAAAWASERGVDVEAFPADWRSQGRAAGLLRNQRMLEAGPDVVVAFSTAWPATRGTGDMCRRAFDAGVPVFFVGPSADGRWFRAQGH